MVSENGGKDDETIIPSSSFRWLVERDEGGHERSTLQQRVTVNGRGEWRSLPVKIVPWGSARSGTTD
jgi:hypothetical protein